MKCERSMFKESVVRTLCVSICLRILIRQVVSEAEIDFGYNDDSPNGPKKWGQLSPEWAMCNEGREQSPIHIKTDRLKVDHTLTDLNTSYNPSPGLLFNDGHALEVDVVNAGHFWLDDEDYKLLRFHFHSPSEHVIDGFQAPLEMHMVHQSSDGKKLAVIGIPFKEGPPSPFLDEFWSKVPQTDLKNVKVNIGELVVDAPHLHMRPNYVRYKGSLTTPPCTQDIIWTVALEVWNTVSFEQIQAFRQVLPEPSARPTQKLHGRVVHLRIADR